jgi:rhodanese-related sulfurtransferase
MGLLAKLVEKAIDRATGRGVGLAPRAAATNAKVSTTNVSTNVTPVTAAKASPPAKPAGAEKPGDSAGSSGAGTLGSTHERLGGRGGVAVMAGSEGPVARAESLANIEAECQELKERFDAGEPVVLVDVRTPDEWAGGVIPGALRIPLDDLESRWKELEKINEVVCYCASGKRSLRAAQLLRDHGIFNATSLEGGFAAWRQRGGKVGTAD